MSERNPLATDRPVISGPKPVRPSSQSARCRLCGCILHRELDTSPLGVCNSCEDRPEARRLGAKPSPNGTASQSARNFTAAEKGVIRRMHGYLPAQQLLDLLNERLAFDLGPDAAPYTMEQLHAEIAECGALASNGAKDWGSLRKLLANARRTGVMDAIDRTVIDDFAVVFSLTPAQSLRLKDVLLQAGEDV